MLKAQSDLMGILGDDIVYMFPAACHLAWANVTCIPCPLRCPWYGFVVIGLSLALIMWIQAIPDALLITALILLMASQTQFNYCPPG